MDAETAFDRELEIFRRETSAATQFLYAHVAVHATMAENEAVADKLNEASLFWMTNLGALQLSAFVVLGRIFDQDKKSKHNVDRLLRLAQDNAEIFTKPALARRKQKASPSAHQWLPAYLRNVYEPSPDDFRRLRAHVRKWRAIYEANYRPIRHQVFAHRSVSDEEATAALFAKTNIREMQRLTTFLGSLHESLRELFLNGSKPNLRPQRYSVKRMTKQPSKGRPQHVQEIIARQARAFLRAAAGVGHGQAD
jgi:hypothetical protein